MTGVLLGFSFGILMSTLLGMSVDFSNSHLEVSLGLGIAYFILWVFTVFGE